MQLGCTTIRLQVHTPVQLHTVHALQQQQTIELPCPGQQQRTTG
jgi:hypothetical protein